MTDHIKAFLYSLYTQSKTRYVERSRWRTTNPSGECLVYYGHDHIPKPGEKASGGIIKCQDLQGGYPNTISGANLLYLVSSSLPPCPEIMVRYAKKNGVKLVVNQNGVAIPAYRGKNLEVINRPRRYLIRHADHVIYQSNYCKISADKYLAPPSCDYSILHNPVDVHVFRMREHNGPHAVPRLLMAGSHGFLYRVVSAVDTVSVLKKKGTQVELHIYGRLAWKGSPDECREELLRLCREKDVCELVKLGRPYTQSEAPSIYQQADVLLHTQYNDACPRVVVEAMACGLPVVYSASGGVPELVGEEGGVGIDVPRDWEKVHPADSEALAGAVQKVLVAYSQYSRNSRTRAESHFDVRPWIEEHRKLFSQLFSR